MRKALLALWILLPVGGWAYHEGPGQDRLRLDTVDGLVAAAHAAALAGDHATAAGKYDEALAKLPAGNDPVARAMRLERAKAWLQSEKLPDARADLERLVGELEKDGTDAELLAGARRSLANARYYFTWLMRLEGLPRETWEPEIDGSRQLYRLLAEASAGGDDQKALRRSKQDLEAAILLERLALSDLQGLPLPSQ